MTNGEDSAKKQTKGEVLASGTEEKKKKKRKKKNKNKKDNAAESARGPNDTPRDRPQALRDNMPIDELFADSDQSEDEGIADYKIGGYHPVHLGEILINRYVILQKLGWGHFSTVWLARDTAYDSFVALKVQKSASHY